MNSLQKTARWAGGLYLTIVFMGLFNLMYVPSQLVVPGNAGETVERILAKETLYRIDMAVAVISVFTFLFLALVLYRLFKPVDQSLAAVMAILVLVQIPGSFVGGLLQLAALSLAHGSGFLSAVPQMEREALALLCIQINQEGAILASFAWGLWLFPLGMLVIRSNYMPKFIGFWLLVNGATYVALFFIGTLWRSFYNTASNYAVPLLLAEVAFALWLLIKGIKLPSPAQVDPA